MTEFDGSFAFDRLFPGDGEMSVRMRAFDWNASPLGPPHGWPAELRTYVNLMLTSRQPMYLAWTHQLIALYNDAYRPILGDDKHPAALGSRTADIFGQDGYPGLKPVFDAALQGGDSVMFENLLVPLVRHGYMEECYFDVSYSPVSVAGQVQGVFCSVTETTERVLAARRTRTLADLTAALLSAGDPQQVIRTVLDVARANPQDLPAVLLHRPAADGTMTLAGSAGLSPADAAPFRRAPEAWGVAQGAQVLDVAPLPTSAWPEPVRQLVLQPLTTPDQSQRLGLLLLGVNPRRELNQAAWDFLNLFSGQVAAALHAAELTRHLQERNAELDARTRALEGFAELTRDLILETDPYALIQTAQRLVGDLLPGSATVYYEPEGDRWQLKLRTGEVHDPALEQVIQAGVPLEQARNLTIPWHSGAPYYQDVYDPATDSQPLATRTVASTATIPVVVSGTVRGVLGVMLFDQRRWTAADKAVLQSVEGSLNLSLQRAQSLEKIDAQHRSISKVNEELEAFAHSVSHDLRTPVRHIKGFNALLRRALGTPIAPGVDRYLTVVSEAADHMDTLIDALLDLSQSSRKPLQLGLVDLGLLVEHARKELEMDALDRRIVWSIHPLPMVQGDADLLRQVLQNLLGNAVKYTRKRSEAHIEVWAEEHSGDVAVWVRDNGAGFDARYVDRLFGVFQRLHRSDEFEGTGIGLANVRRIVERHGGTVTATGTLGEGATFGFRLPRT
ncbi:ATP-binding protein [Deinococcus sonorensis]|uniref:histidine kinase n=2 Tax=Deinococcus sonorensis TaxID=309891 RepID=A0AAU7UCE8_9DEIO